MLMNESKRDLNLSQLLNLSMRICHGVCYIPDRPGHNRNATSDWLNFFPVIAVLPHLHPTLSRHPGPKITALFKQALSC